MASSSRILAEDIVLNGRYRIMRVLGRGGMGTVYLARHEELDSVLAIKEVSAPNVEDEAYQMALEACRKESKLLFRLEHPNLPKVTDAFVEDGRFYLVMEYIDGVTLETKLREAQGRPLDPRQVAEWGLQITDVLGYLHHLDPPLIFRDLKPANIMVQSDGRIRLIDFGIARNFEEGKAKDTALLGSVGYSPPEQFGQHQTDARSDIYAFGATLHHLLTGRDPAAQPFKFPPASALNPMVPDNFSRLVDRCLALEADKRPADVRDIAMELLAIRDQLAAAPTPHSSAARPGMPVAPNATTQPSGATTGSGPRVISSKLKDAEPKRSNVAVLATALLALLVIIGGTLFALKKPATATKEKTKPTQGIANTPAVKPTEPIIPSTTTPPVITDTTTAPPPAANDSAKIDSVSAIGVSTDAQGTNWLQVQVKGVIKSHNGKSGMVAVFFYDDNEQPIFITPGTPYSNDKGHLSVAHSLVIDSDLYAIDQTLAIPVEQFPKDKQTSALKYKCIVYVDGTRLAETKISPLEVSAVTSPQTNSSAESNPPANTGNGNP